VNDPAVRAIGGAVVADHGAISIAEARALAAFYALEAEAGGGGWPQRCLVRAEAMEAAVARAALWRRAAGWADPDAADRV